MYFIHYVPHMGTIHSPPLHEREISYNKLILHTRSMIVNVRLHISTSGHRKLVQSRNQEVSKRYHNL